jgi:N-hydroxyarylamine O-acetyltransferase
MNVPFENLDIHYRRFFDLELSNIYKKVVDNSRGGFCYELNYLFRTLLSAVGFSTKIISARVFDEDGMPGPEYDHMAIYVRTDRDYIGDVGFGDLFIHPLEIREGVQDDGRHLFLIEPNRCGEYILSMSSDKLNFQKKYSFSLKEVPVECFREPCIYKQTSPESYFVKNTVCTMATETGRVTLFNDKLIRKNYSDRSEISVLSDADLRAQLRRNFNIEIL